MRDFAIDPSQDLMALVIADDVARYVVFNSAETCPLHEHDSVSNTIPIFPRHFEGDHAGMQYFFLWTSLPS